MTEGFVSWFFTDAGRAIFAGAMGGLVRWLSLRDNWKEGMTAVLVGAICALYLGPLIEPLIEPVIGKIAPGEDAGGFASFMCGLGGISIAGMVIDIFTKRRDQAASESDGDAK